MNETAAPTPPTPPPPPPAAPPPPAGGEIDYPVHVDVDRQEEYSRFLPLIKWLLLIPHYFVLFFLGIGALFAFIVAALAVLFTGRYPRGIFGFVTGVYRWVVRVNAYHLLMTDAYPPFSLQPDPAEPARFEIEYPEQGVARWRPFFAWLLAIPYLFVATLIFYLAMVMVLIAFFAILFTRRFPEGMFNIVLVAMRWQARGNAYTYAWTTRYPPFTWG